MQLTSRKDQSITRATLASVWFLVWVAYNAWYMVAVSKLKSVMADKVVGFEGTAPKQTRVVSWIKTHPLRSPKAALQKQKTKYF